MRISRSDWQNYINKLSAVNKKAAEVMQQWMDANPDSSAEDMVGVAYAVAEHYGEAAGSLACTMYDAIAEAQGAAVPPAVPAETATYGETAKAVYGTLKNKQNTVPATVGRLVKQTGADTMLQNARRDGAQFAWIPMGDSCAFCLTLASRGWQYQSKKAMKNGHAEHIHANCDCEYAIRFDGKSSVEGYDPDALREKYESFDGKPDEKIKAWRREIKGAKKVPKPEGTSIKRRNTPTDVTAEYFLSAKPGTGSITYQPRYDKGKKHASEIKMAKMLHDTFGGDIVLLAESTDEGVMTPDYLWNGKLWDLKEPTTAKAADDRLRHGAKQIRSNPGGIILDYKSNEFDLSEIREVIDKRAKRVDIDSFDVMLVSKDKIIAILKYKK